jgi:hypothetical protein
LELLALSPNSSAALDCTQIYLGLSIREIEMIILKTDNTSPSEKMLNDLGGVGVDWPVLLNSALWVEKIHLETDLHLLEGMRKTNLLERLGAFLLAFSYQNRLDQIEALKKKGIQ